MTEQASLVIERLAKAIEWEKHYRSMFEADRLKDVDWKNEPDWLVLLESAHAALSPRSGYSDIRTESERKAGVTPVDPAYPEGDARRYGAVGNAP